MHINDIINRDLIKIKDNLFIDNSISDFENQEATNSAFSDKWKNLNNNEDIQRFNDFQINWYYSLYGFENEKEFQKFLQGMNVILDAGCGIGYKSAWFAKLNPKALVIGMDFSESVYQAAELYKDISNLIFIRGDIAKTCFKNSSIDFINCDQVIHHTENPQKTLNHFAEILTKTGVITLYVYAKKAVPRELIDEYFREMCKKTDKSELWNLSSQLTELGKTLSDLNITFDCPEIPLLNIKGGKMDIQRFIYNNFLKIFWNEQLGYHNSVLTNYDWYSPANAYRYSVDEFKEMIISAELKTEFFRSESACHTAKLVRI